MEVSGEIKHNLGVAADDFLIFPTGTPRHGESIRFSLELFLVILCGNAIWN